MSSAKTVFHTQVLPQESPLSRLLSRHHDGRHAGFVVYLNRASPRSMRRFVLKGLLVNIALTLVMAWLAAGTIFHDLVSPPQDCMDIIVSCIRDALIIFAILTMAVTTVVPFLCQSLLLVRFRSQPYRIVFRALNRPDDPAKDDSSLGADPLVDYYDIWDTLTKDVKHHFYLASVQTHALLAEGKVSEANLDGVIYQYADGVWHRWTTNDTTHQDYAEALLRHHGKKMALLTQVRAWMQCSTKPQSLVDAFAFEGYNYDGIHSQFIERQFYIQKPCALV